MCFIVNAKNCCVKAVICNKWVQHVIDNQKYSYKEEMQAIISENNKEIRLETEEGYFSLCAAVLDGC